MFRCSDGIQETLTTEDTEDAEEIPRKAKQEVKADLAPKWAPIHGLTQESVTKATGRAAVAYKTSKEHLVSQLATAESLLGFTRNRSAPTYRAISEGILKACAALFVRLVGWR
jgi:hypothetical protein